MSYQDEYADAIEQQFYDLENRIMADIIRRIKKEGKITSTADWQVNKLVDLGYSSAEIEAMIMDSLNATWPEMFELYDEVIDWEYVRNAEIYEQINEKFILYEENGPLKQWVEAAKQQTQNTLVNITATLGVATNINGQMTFLPLTEFYHKELDAAVMDISSGAFDYNSVLKRTVNALANSGIRTIDYDSGYSSRLPVAVRRAVMTGVSQLTGKISDMNAEKLHTDHFEVAWHEGARPSHREWQGKVYSRDELVTVCGLGSVTGLKGVNCYHNYYPFIPGVSERNWTDEWLEEQNRLEDIPKYYKGKGYTAYEARQMQRRMETSMRAQRQKVRLLEEGGADKNDIIIAKARYQGQLAEYRQFSGAMELKPHMERVYIDGLGRVVPGGSVKPIMSRTRGAHANEQRTPENSGYADVTDTWLKNATPNSHEIKDLKKFVVDGTTYKVNGKSVQLRYSANEKKTAEILKEQLGGSIEMVPKIQGKNGKRTPDYIFRGERYDLKVVQGKSRHALYNRLKDAKGQSDNFVLDITEFPHSDKEIDEQIKYVYNSHHLKFVNNIILIKDGKIVKVFSR